MNDIEVSSIDLVEGGNVFKQGHYLTLGYVPRDEKGETVDLSGKTLNVSLWGRKGVVFEAAATYSGGVIRFTFDKLVAAGDYTVEFTATSSTDAKYRKKFPTNQHSGRIAIKQSADDLGVVGISVYTIEKFEQKQKAIQDAYEQAVDSKVTEIDQRLNDGIGALTEDSEVIDARMGKANLRQFNEGLTAQLAETAKKFRGGEVTLSEYGNFQEGDDISFLVNSAVNDLITNHGGGVVKYPSGSYIAQGLMARSEISHIGVGQFSTKLELPAVPTNHLFVTQAESLAGGGIYNMEIAGPGKEGFNGIDLSTALSGEAYDIENCYIHHFNNGVRGTLNDRQVLVQKNRIHSNGVGYYIIRNHPTFGVNDIRSNDIGVGGEILYDIQMHGTRFVYNKHGIKANLFEASHITGCFFFKNSVSALEIDNDMNVVGCLFVPTDTLDTGIIIKGVQNIVSFNTFRKEDTQKFGITAIQNDGGAGNKIENNNFECDEKILSINNLTGEVTHLSFVNNTLTGKNVHVHQETGDRAVKYSSFSGNRFHFANNSNTTKPALKILNTYHGNEYMNNSFTAHSAAIVGVSMSIDARYSMVVGNRQTRNFGEIEILQTNADTVNMNNGKYR